MYLITDNNINYTQTEFLVRMFYHMWDKVCLLGGQSNYQCSIHRAVTLVLVIKSRTVPGDIKLKPSNRGNWNKSMPLLCGTQSTCSFYVLGLTCFFLLLKTLWNLFSSNQKPPMDQAEGEQKIQRWGFKGGKEGQVPGSCSYRCHPTDNRRRETKAVTFWATHLWHGT